MTAQGADASGRHRCGTALRCALALMFMVVAGSTTQLFGEHVGTPSPQAVRRLSERSVTTPPAEVGSSSAFVNWESPHVHPMDVTPSGDRLLAVNTADNRLEVFDIDETGLIPVGAVAVGLDPVSVRARSDTEAWVVNHVSDSISVVDLQTLAVRATIHTGDEPADVVFAGTPARAFVSVSQLNEVRVFDPDDLAAEPDTLAIEGEDPRALATDGERVYVAIFESGNGTTRVINVLSPLSPYPGSPSPPPNDGDQFNPPMAPGLPTPPPTAMIVRKDAGGWFDDNAHDWSALVGWDLLDHDLAVIDTGDLSVEYVSGLMNINMALTVFDDRVAVVGTEATNQVRFEPNLNGTFVRSVLASVQIGEPPIVFDINAHLDYSSSTVEQAQRDQSIGDPRGVVVSTSGLAYVAGMGSNNVLRLGGAELERVEVGGGPTGMVLDEARGQLYVLNRFDAAISIVDTDAMTETDRIAFFDPTPEIIKAGRPFLYDTHLTSGLGQASCASCHVDARWDALAWDLGDPSGAVEAFEGECLPDEIFGDCADWHPMKGPMTTQTLMGISELGQMHWRGDKPAGVPDFNGAYVSLLGDDTELAPEEVDALDAYIATMTPPPNPYRNIDGTLKTTHPNGGDPTEGHTLFTEEILCPDAAPTMTCVVCHALPHGTSGVMLSLVQPMKMTPLLAVYEKTGFDPTSVANTRGFGLFHHGSVGSVSQDLEAGPLPEQGRLDVEAFVHSVATMTHAGVGVQATLGGTGADQTALRDELIGVAEIGDVGLVVKGRIDDVSRGFYLAEGSYQSDRADELWTLEALDAQTSAGAVLTYTLVPAGSEIRIGVDRDEDGFFDLDEIEDCADPADPESTPETQGCCPADLDDDDVVGYNDVLVLLASWGICEGCAADLDDDGEVGFNDILGLMASWGPCPAM